MINERQMMELLQIVSSIKKQYEAEGRGTLTYERAETLMDCVNYCINESIHVGHVIDNDTNMQEAYQQGLKIIEDKVAAARADYRELMSGLNDYDIINYRNVVVYGLADFFGNYDAVIAPMDNIAANYPLMKWSIDNGKVAAYGIDLIEDYVRCLRIERAFLDNYEEAYVLDVIGKVCEKTATFRGNICEEVLYAVVKERYEKENASVEDILMKIAIETGIMKLPGGGTYLFAMGKIFSKRLEK